MTRERAALPVLATRLAAVAGGSMPCQTKVLTLGPRSVNRMRPG